MGHKKARYLLIGLAVCLTLLAAFGAGRPPASTGNQPGEFNLVKPEFVTEAYAANSPIGMYLDEEAGISAYYNSGFTINLSSVRSAYRTIETETADYIIGSVAVPNHVEHFDPHVYVHKDGWIMAYYLRPDPIGKIIDVRGSTISSTLLKTVVGIVASHAGVPFTDVTYYDFRYPNATKMVLVAENAAVGDKIFSMEIPSSYGYYERGWSVCCNGAGHFNLNGVSDPNKIYDANYHRYGTITASQLLANVEHSVYVSYGYGVLIIVYRE
jgi:hypothetical protein